MNLILQILTLLGGVTLFLFGLGLLSGGLQKVAGDGLRAFLASMTSNPFKQIITGIGVTAVIQSSTATTSAWPTSPSRSSSSASSFTATRSKYKWLYFDVVNERNMGAKTEMRL